MPRWASTITIAGVDFSGCRGLIQGGSEFDTEWRGSIDWAADGTPHVQIIDVGVKGLPFGIQIPNIEASKIASALTAIRAAEATQSTFVVELTDALNTISVLAYPDYSQRPWFTHGPESEGMIADVVFRFISMAQAPSP